MLAPLLVLLVLLAAAGECRSEPRAPEVKVEAGVLRGKWIQSHFSKRNVAAFEGVPYAEPPVGALRFQPPVAAAAWPGVKAADRVSPVCIQRDFLLGKQNIEGSEDCLYLNVYAPETVSRTQPLPVMVFIHGGGFVVWSGAMNGPELLMERDVVYVNFNYRLGPLGFLSSGDEVIHGNYGLKDMVMALTWVRDNIRSFGGDPGSVTIFGESAGGAAVHYLTLSPLGRGLFHRAIPMSGNAHAPGAYHDRVRAKKTSTKLATVLGCPVESSQMLRECLQNKPAEDIIATDMAFSEWYGHPMLPFRPVDEPSQPGAFLDRHPRQLVPHDIPLMIGLVSGEGCVISASLLQTPDALKDLNERFDEVAPLTLFMEHLPDRVKSDLSNEIRHGYFAEKLINADATTELTQVYSDFYFYFPTIKSIKQQKTHARSAIYFYELDYYSDERSFGTIFGGNSKNTKLGMCHCDDLMYLFPFEGLFSQNLSASDRSYTDLILDLFTTFAATGKPTADDSWTKVQDADEPEYAYIAEAGELTMRRSYASEKKRLWDRVEAARNMLNLVSTREEL